MDRNTARAWVFTAVILSVVATFLVLLFTSADRADGAQPMGGCKEAFMAPESAGADDCRSMGWQVDARYVVSPSNVLRYYDLPTCRNDDGSGQRTDCGVNVGEGCGDAYLYLGPERGAYRLMRWVPDGDARPHLEPRTGPCRTACPQAYSVAESTDAAECRDHGWLVGSRYVVSPRYVLRYYNLPSCTYEDGSGQRSACGWNVVEGDGNGHGRAGLLLPNGPRMDKSFIALNVCRSGVCRPWMR